MQGIRARYKEKYHSHEKRVGRSPRMLGKPKKLERRKRKRHRNAGKLDLVQKQRCQVGVCSRTSGTRRDSGIKFERRRGERPGRHGIKAKGGHSF